MKTYFAGVIALLGILSAVAPASAATNLFQNGGFETGSFSGWTLNDSCSAPPPGPNRPVCGVGADGAGLSSTWNMMVGASSVIAHSGDYAAYAYSKNLSLSQSVQFDQAGTYEVSFFLGANFVCPTAHSFSYGAPTVSLNGVSMGFSNNPAGSAGTCTTAPDQMQQFVSDFVIAAPGTYDFSFGINADRPALSMDDFSLVQMPAGVPEPATWAMFLLGFGAIGFALRRAKSTALTA